MEVNVGKIYPSSFSLVTSGILKCKNCLDLQMWLDYKIESCSNRALAHYDLYYFSLCNIVNHFSKMSSKRNSYTVSFKWLLSQSLANSLNISINFFTTSAETSFNFPHKSFRKISYCNLNFSRQPADAWVFSISFFFFLLLPEALVAIFLYWLTSSL